MITFVAGITLVVSTPAASELQAEMFKPLIAVIFLITAFMGIVAVVLPSFRHDGLFTKSQMLPWLAWGLVYVIGVRDGNLIDPAAVITMLVLERNIPWNRLLVLQEDILSRRVIMIAFTVEVALLIFLGALLYLIDPDTGSLLIHHMTLRARVASVVFFIILSIMNYYITSTSYSSTPSSRSTKVEDDYLFIQHIGVPYSIALRALLRFQLSTFLDEADKICSHISILFMKI